MHFHVLTIVTQIVTFCQYFAQLNFSTTWIGLIMLMSKCKAIAHKTPYF